MKVRESGIILFTENYERVVEYYIKQIGLNLRLEKEKLAILDIGNSYLMIEDTGIASTTEKTREQSSICIRLDVIDFDETVRGLRDRGVSVEVKRFSWGTIGVIIDIEGNRIEIKDGNL